MSEDKKSVEEYGDSRIASKDEPIPLWLKISYILVPLWGFLWLYLYWNGEGGFLDRGYWIELERAANTTYPYINADQPAPPKKSH